MRFDVSAPALVTIQRGLDEAPAMVQHELLAMMTELTLHLEGEVKDVWPTGIFNSRQSITSDAFASSAGVLGVVGTNSPYAPVIEDGRRPGKGVSRAGREALAMWAVGKLGVSVKESSNVAFLIARKIKARGLAAKQPFAKTFDRNRGAIARAIEDAAERIAAKLGTAQ